MKTPSTFLIFLFQKVYEIVVQYAINLELFIVKLNNKQVVTVKIKIGSSKWSVIKKSDKWVSISSILHFQYA